MFGTKGTIEGKNLLLESSLIKITDVLTIPCDLSLNNDTKLIAQELVSSLPQLPVDLKTAMTRFRSFENHNYPPYKAFELNDKLATSHNTSDILDATKNIIAFMQEEHHMLKCLVVRIVEKFQTYISAIKILFIYEKYGLKEMQGRVENNILGSILPGLLEPLEYFNALTRLAPMAISLPFIRYEGCYLHFYRDKINWFGDRWWLESYFSEYSISCSPAVTTSFNDLSESLGGYLNLMSLSDIKDYMDMTLLAVNNLFKYFLNISFFTNENGVVQNIKILKALGAIKLIFSDLRELNLSVSMYHRTNLSFSVFDKISNLACFINNKTSREVTGR